MTNKLPGKSLDTIVTISILEDHDVVAAVSLEIDDLAMFAHRLHIENGEF